MKILHCIATMEGGGAERQLCYLAKGLVDNGISVHVAIIKEGVNYQRLQESGAIVHKLTAHSNYTPGIIFQLCSIIRAVRPSVVQCWQRPMEVFGAVSALLCRVPFITVERTAPLVFSRSYKTVMKRGVSQFAAAVVSNSEQGRSFWEGQLLRKIPNRVIRNIVPFSEMPTRQPRTRGRDYLVAVGRLSPEKNYEVLIDAMAAISEAWPHLDLYILGEGPQHEQLAAKVRQNGLNDRVHLAGYCDDVWERVRNARVYVSLSLFEGLPNTVIEAAALSCPLLLSDIAAHRAIFDEASATYCDHTSADAVAQKIREMLLDPQQLEGKVRRAAIEVNQCDTSSVSLDFMDLYSQIAKR